LIRYRVIVTRAILDAMHPGREGDDAHRDQEIPSTHQFSVGFESGFEFVGRVVLPLLEVARITSFDEIKDDHALLWRYEERVDKKAPFCSSEYWITYQKVSRANRIGLEPRGQGSTRRRFIVRPSRDDDRSRHGLIPISYEPEDVELLANMVAAHYRKYGRVIYPK